uniref:Uncharacterized protein n=1 Tax=Micrurus spixii TaxID=129469 RepID=A0A2D4LRE2_9SAUR
MRCTWMAGSVSKATIRVSSHASYKWKKTFCPFNWVINFFPAYILKIEFQALVRYTSNIFKCQVNYFLFLFEEGKRNMLLLRLFIEAASILSQFSDLRSVSK